jgi:hypothetical protein
MIEEKPWGTLRLDFGKSPAVSIIIMQESGVVPIGGGSPVRYATADSLPEWLQRKVSVLMGVDYNIPTEPIPGIGRRISRHVFWVFCTAGETLGRNPRKKSKKPSP